VTVRPRIAGFAAILLAFASPALAQWTRVTDLPVTDVFSVWVKGDTITAGVDTAAYVSTNGGATWKRSAKVTTGVTSVEVVRVHKGRLYAGTIGQGMFVSLDSGDTWLPFNQGLTGGIANSHLFIKDLLVRGDSLFAATAGAGPWVRNLAATPGSWSHYGAVFEPNQASNMEAIAAGGSRLLACAGANGTVFFRDPGQPDWTLSWMNNLGIVAGLGALTSIWTGTGWVVGSNVGVFRSTLGQSPWTFTDVGLGTLLNVSFALRGPVLFGMFGTGAGSTIEFSRDHGATWQFVEELPFIFTYGIATHGSTLYAARFDGLWRRSVANVSAPPVLTSAQLRFAVVGPQPVRDHVRFGFELPEAGHAAIDIFDIGGRRAGRIANEWPAGSNETRWDSSALPAGVYLARLSVGARSEVVRFVRVR
jgi:hypothetical protein